jgi:transposase InsO family protein
VQTGGTEPEPPKPVEDDGPPVDDGDPIDRIFRESARRAAPMPEIPQVGRGDRTRRLAKGGTRHTPTLTAEQRLLILDTWRRSELPAKDFAAMVGISKHTLYKWNQMFEKDGPAGLLNRPRGGKSGSRLPQPVRRSILMLKDDHPDWGCQRISDVLARGPGMGASPGAVGRVLKEEGYELIEARTQPHGQPPRRFERARPNQLWQTDLFSFVLKRQNRRAYLVAFLDDHSRFLVGFGLHASQSTALVLEVLRSALTAYGCPEEILTDNGTQYVTWRGTSAFRKELQSRGIRHVVASPRHPQTLGKIERFWGSLWRECAKAAVFVDLADARTRIGHFVDYYNFHRPHQGIDGLVPADRFFELAPEVRSTLQARVAANALDLARHGLPKAPFYLTGQAGGKTFSVHAEGERVFLSRPGEQRTEVDLVPPTGDPVEMPEPVCPQGVVGTPESPPDRPPGASPLDAGLAELREGLQDEQGGAS